MQVVIVIVIAPGTVVDMVYEPEDLDEVADELAQAVTVEVMVDVTVEVAVVLPPLLVLFDDGQCPTSGHWAADEAELLDEQSCPASRQVSVEPDVEAVVGLPDPVGPAEYSAIPTTIATTRITTIVAVAPALTAFLPLMQLEG